MEAEGTPSVRRCCQGCNSVMTEVRKGIINKVSEPETVKVKDEPKPVRKTKITKRKAKK